jgi:cysteine desulfurase
MKLPIYLDYNSTTPVDPRVVEAMMPFFTESFGNSASRNHAFGWEVEEVVEDARESIGNVIGASGKEIVFTSGATESNNLAILGAADFYQKKGKHIITSPIEHKAVIDPCHALEQRGYEITFLKVDKDGCINLKQLEESIREDTILVSLMAANNEIGTINPLKKIGEITRAKGALFHTDATQGVGKIPIDVDEMVPKVWAHSM